ncbi:MAG TPA: hypothetical protein DD424_03850 [Porphyromonadaceae bacterium]|nr:hypothetical protein [Porphyromonadaceae bacterium]
MNAPIMDRGSPMSVMTARRIRELSDPVAAVCIPANIAEMAHRTHIPVTRRDGVQAHFTDSHAIERVRERRAVIGVEYRALIVGPVRITRGELDGLPGTLKRMDCCITSTLWVIAYRQTKKRLPFRCYNP